jgi:uncharacterized membrane protein
MASLLLLGAMAAFAVYAAALLPPGSELPTHWNARGDVDGTMPALQALLLAPAMGLGLSVLFALVPRLEPMQDRLEKSASLLRTAWIGSLMLLVFVQAMIAAPAFGIPVEGHYALFGVGLLFLPLGNMLPKSRPGFFVGIRTPWTIVDEDTWIATHRLGGKLMMLAGAVLVALPLLPLAPGIRATSAVTTIFTAVLVPAIYSWWLWHRKKIDRASGA